VTGRLNEIELSAKSDRELLLLTVMRVNGDIYYSIRATGVGTAAIVLQIAGYWL
jgi:hypothetical protein